MTKCVGNVSGKYCEGEIFTIFTYCEGEGKYSLKVKLGDQNVLW